LELAEVGSVEGISPYQIEIEANTPSKMVQGSASEVPKTSGSEDTDKMSAFYNSIRFYSRIGRLIFTIEEMQAVRHKLYRVARALNCFT
jgi:hypothetical protein